jgi:hypothetical protein
MAELGKTLVFYLKYTAEMNRLYADLEEGEERDLTGLDNAESVLEMARAIGDAACARVADFLTLCGKVIEDHFTGLGIATLAKKRTRRFVEKYWQWEAQISLSSVPTIWCGVSVGAPPDVRISLANDVCGVVIAYLWPPKGGRKAADGIWEILGGWPHSRGVEGPMQYTNVVTLACIPIKPKPLASFDVDRDPLIAEVMKTFARIGAKETKAIAKFVAGLKEPEES